MSEPLATSAPAQRAAGAASSPHPPLTELRSADLGLTLAQIASHYQPVAFASSFGAEDMVLLDAIARHGLAVDVFVLDTGRLPAETYDLIARAQTRYAMPIRVLYPDARSLEDYVSRNGVNAFYQNVELRERCCAIRKTEPLSRALVGKAAWITGLRREQSVTRRELGLHEFDAAHGIPKFNPLLEWSTDEVWAYIGANEVPYNALHDRGYPSIGCSPCTRAVEAGDDLRSGRWWWEQAEHRECGLHRRPVQVPVIVSPETTGVLTAQSPSARSAERRT